MKWIVLLSLVACSSKKSTTHDAAARANGLVNNYGDDPPIDATEVDAKPIKTAPFTLVLPPLIGKPALGEGVLVVALVPDTWTWRLVDPAAVTVAMGTASIPVGQDITAPDIASRATPAGVLVLADAKHTFERVSELAFALHNECWAFAGVNDNVLATTWPDRCPPATGEAIYPMIAVDIEESGATVATREKLDDRDSNTYAHSHRTAPIYLRDEHARLFAKRKDLVFAIHDRTSVASIVTELAGIHAAGFTEARWVPPEWLPMRFPSGRGSDPPRPPPPPPPRGPRSVSVAIAPPVATNRNADDVSRVIKARAGVFRACYQKELNRTPNLGGKLDVAFEIALDGKVANVTMKGSLKHEAVVQCLTSNFGRLFFPAAEKKSRVKVSLVFSHTP